MRNRRRRDERPTPSTLQVRDDLALVLDGLNAWGCVEKWKDAENQLKQITCFGPGVFRGYLPSSWVGVVMWYKRRGCYHYDTLYMVGVWAVRGDIGIEVVVGTKEAAYSHPLYHAEAYYRRMQTEFRTYYQDDGSPPALERRLYAQVYDPAQRLEIRKTLERLLNTWADQYRAASEV